MIDSLYLAEISDTDARCWVSASKSAGLTAELYSMTFNSDDGFSTPIVCANHKNNAILSCDTIETAIARWQIGRYEGTYG